MPRVPKAPASLLAARSALWLRLRPNPQQRFQGLAKGADRTRLFEGEARAGCFVLDGASRPLRHAFKPSGACYLRLRPSVPARKGTRRMTGPRHPHQQPRGLPTFAQGVGG
jgi:hypothetical protein